MRILKNLINPLTLFWCAVYALALSSFFIAGILTGTRDSKKAPAKN
jgi:hypothetical protein